MRINLYKDTRPRAEIMAQLPGTVLKVWDDQVDVDQIFRHLGRYGKYQTILYVQTLLGIVPAAVNILANVFTGFEPEHQCQVLDNHTIERYHRKMGKIAVESYGKCAVKIQRDEDFQFLSCPGNYKYKDGKYASFVSEWDLVCDKEELANLVTTVFHVGMMIGAALFPSLADKHGRKPVYVGSRIGTFVVNLAAILSPNYGFFLGCRFLCGLLQPGMNVPGTIMIAELFPTENRTHVLLLGGVMWVFGVIIMAPVAYIFRSFNWRVLHTVFTFFFICSFIEIWTLDESIRWLIAKNRWSEAKRLIRKAANKNDVDYNYVAYLFRHFDPDEREEYRETSDNREAETEVGSEDCSVSGDAFENIEPVQVTQNELNETEKVCSKERKNTFTDDIDNTESVNNGRSCSEQDKIDSNKNMEEMNTTIRSGQTRQDLRGPGLAGQSNEANENEKDVRNICVVGMCQGKHVISLEEGNNNQMDVSSVVSTGGVVKLISLNPLLDNITQKNIDKQTQKNTMLQCKLPGMLYIIKEPVLRRIVFICLYLWFVNTLVYYALYLTSASLAGNRYLNFFLNALAEFPSQVLALKLLISIGRKKTCIIFQSIAGGSLIIAVILRMSFSDNHYIVMAATFFSLIGMFGISGSFLVIWLYTPELFPTGLRNAGMGLASTASRIGSMLSPFSGTLARHISWGPSVIFASFCLVANLLVLTLPETGHRQLPQTVGDIRRWSDEEDDTWNSQYAQQMMRSFRLLSQQHENTNTRNVIHLQQQANEEFSSV